MTQATGEQIGVLTPLKVFLCHCAEDKPVVHKLYDVLKSAGFDPWLDEHNLLGGQDWKSEIEKAIRAADAVVVCLSKTSVRKEGFGRREIKFALETAEEKLEGSNYLIPLVLEECKVPSPLETRHWVKYYEEKGHHDLIKALAFRAEELGRGSQPRTYEELVQGLIDTVRLTDISIQVFYQGVPQEWMSISVQLHKLLCTKPSLISLVFPNFKLHPVRNKPPVKGPRPIAALPFTITGSPHGIKFEIFDEEQPPIPLSEWLDQTLCVLPLKGQGLYISVSEFIQVLTQTVAAEYSPRTNIILEAINNLFSFTPVGGQDKEGGLKTMMLALGEYVVSHLIREIKGAGLAPPPA